MSQHHLITKTLHQIKSRAFLQQRISKSLKKVTILQRKQGQELKSKIKKGATTTIPEGDGGKGKDRWWRCTTDGVWGNNIFIHRTNYQRVNQRVEK